MGFYEKEFHGIIMGKGGSGFPIPPLLMGVTDYINERIAPLASTCIENRFGYHSGAQARFELS